MESTFPPIIRLTGRAVPSLASFIHGKSASELEAVRIARAGYALLTSGCSIRSSGFLSKITSSIVSRQQIDGGWADIEETLWCLGYLSSLKAKNDAQLARGRQWLLSVRLPSGAWGKSSRDQPRIPVTALACVLLPDIIDTGTLDWMSEQWGADLADPTPLTYKAAFYLLSMSHYQAHASWKLVESTIEYLEREQNEDGGFGPWKGHPIGSCPWTTGVVLWGLSKAASKVSGSTLSRAISWLEAKQLSNGLWPYHYLDDATSMVLIGLSSVLPMVIKQGQLCAE